MNFAHIFTNEFTRYSQRFQIVLLMPFLNHNNFRKYFLILLDRGFSAKSYAEFPRLLSMNKHFLVADVAENKT